MGIDAGTYAFLAHAISGASGLASGITQANALKAQGSFESRQAEINARLAEDRAKDAIRRGDRTAQDHLRSTSALQSAQRASYAGQGVDVGIGTPSQMVQDTGVLGAQDAETIRQNAFREAWGHKAEAVNFRTAGRISRVASRGQARQTLLSGGLGLVRDLSMGAYLARSQQPQGTPVGPGSDGPLSMLTKSDLERLRRRAPFYGPMQTEGLG